MIERNFDAASALYQDKPQGVLDHPFSFICLVCNASGIAVLAPVHLQAVYFFCTLIDIPALTTISQFPNSVHFKSIR